MISIKEHESKGDYITLIKELKAAISKDKSLFTNTEVKGWLGRRWRNLFINEALNDDIAMQAATNSGFLGLGSDKRPDRQKVAERFIRGEGPNEWSLEMPPAQINEIKNTTLLFCPGMLNGLLPVRAFSEALPALEKKFKLDVLRSDLHPMRGCNANSEDLLNSLNKGLGLTADCEIISEQNAKPPKDVWIITYSKGCPDLLTLLVNQPELKDRIKCIFNWAGAPGGSYLADDILISVKDLPIEKAQAQMDGLLKMISPVINFKEGSMRRLSEFDVKTCIHDTSTAFRGEFMEKNSDAINNFNIPIFNITGSTTVTEVPYFQIQGVNRLNTFDANNDMQVTQDQAKIKMPMATDLAMMHGNHWDLSYGPFPKSMRFGSPHLDHPFPKEAAATAMFLLAAELGLID